MYGFVCLTRYEHKQIPSYSYLKSYEIKKKVSYSELSLIIVDVWTCTPIEASTSSPGNSGVFSKKGLTTEGNLNLAWVGWEI